MNPPSASSSLRDPAIRFTRVALLAVAMLTTLVAPRLALADVPGRVGRIAFIEGDVQAYSETDPTWKVAYLNQPITSRNSIFVGDAGRAEISVGSTTLAMDAGSQVDVQQLDDNTFDANVVRGRVSMRVRRLDPNDAYNVAVPGADFALLRPGRYRIDALPSTGGITVFEGQASVAGDRGDVLVEAGNGLRVNVNPSDPDAAPQLLSAAPTSVPLDDWVIAREGRFRNSQAERYVSPNMTGYEDLDANGRWSNEQDVGPVWYPTAVQANWAPYRYGRWAYVAPWGYTWIDDAPWGFAPFHYGRWVQVGSRWGWAPGSYIARPAYAPALVGFYGGSNFSASFSIGSGPAVGWYPLAPWQRYSPHYTNNAVYVNQVNNITIVNAPRRFGGGDGGRDWNREHGGTIAPRDAFSSQRSISRVAVAAPRNVFDRARPVEVADLPRPAQIPGAVRRGPDAGRGDARPDFRPPRDFANRPNPGGPRSAEQGTRPDDRRPNGVEGLRPGRPDAQQTPGAPGMAGRDNRPQGQVPVQPVRPGAPAGEGQGFEQPRYTPRAQPQIRNDGDQRLDQRLPAVQPQPADRQGPEQRREQRNVQQPPQGQAPQVVEQRQQPRFERPAPAQAQQQDERQQQAERQQQIERQQQAERQQQIERQQQAGRQQAERQQQVQQQQVQQQQAERQQQLERQQQQAGRQQAERQQQVQQQQQAERQQQIERQQQAGRQQAERQQQVQQQQAERQQQLQQQQAERQQRVERPAQPVQAPAPVAQPRQQPQAQPAPQPAAGRPDGPRELNRDR